MTRQEELNEAWCKYMCKCSTEIVQALAFALRWCIKTRSREWLIESKKLEKKVDDEIRRVTSLFPSIEKGGQQ